MTENIFTSLVAPVVTEKSSKLQGAGKYTFYVSPSANKHSIKAAFQKAYGVEVKSVNIIKTIAKSRMGRNRNLVQKRPSRVKAVITLKDNKTLDLASIK